MNGLSLRGVHITRGLIGILEEIIHVWVKGIAHKLSCLRNKYVAMNIDRKLRVLTRSTIRPSR